MKPKWEDAPDWAEWLARDSDRFGEWVWFKFQPVLFMGQWCCDEDDNGKSFLVAESDDHSEESLGFIESRP